MVSILPPRRGPVDYIADQMSQFSRNLPELMEKRYQTGQLQEAFDKLNPGQNFFEQMKAIGPQMLSAPGGAQAFGELAPVLQKQHQSQAHIKYLQDQLDEYNGKNKPNQSNQQTGQNSNSVESPKSIVQPGQQPQQNQQQPIEFGTEDWFRNPEARASAEGLYPEQSAGLQESPEMTYPEIRQKALNMVVGSGGTISYPEALKTVTGENEEIIARNDRVKKQKTQTQEANKELISGALERARNSNLIKSPEDETVLSNFALKGARLPPQQQWPYIRSQMGKYDTAKSKLATVGDIVDPITGAYRKKIGTYKDKEAIIRDAQDPLKFYRENGLFNEARNAIEENIGFGPDDTERTLFPSSEQEMQGLNKFPPNSVKVEKPKQVEGSGFEQGIGQGIAKQLHRIKNGLKEQFPGEEYNLPPEKFQYFKDKLDNFLKETPKANLVNIRSVLNQNQKYSHQDINKAITELINEGRFIPDVVQDQQMQVVQQAPLPGLLQMFEYVWKGKK